MPKPRIEKWLPRGGLGYAGLATAGTSLIVSFTSEPKWALSICIVAVIASIWFAIGLRSDYEAGESIDTIVVPNDSVDSFNLEDFLLGNEKTSVLRISTIIVILALIGVAIAIYRLSVVTIR